MTGVETRERRAATAACEIFGAIGRDHAMGLDELTHDGTGAAAAVSGMWAVYERHWRRFCGSQLDPQFCHLDHPARLTGRVRTTAGAPVVVVGTGPSLAPALPALRRVRPGLHLITSPRGADVLLEAGIAADLILVEHQTALDAHFSLRDRVHRPSQALAGGSLVAADPRTPAALLAGVPADRLFVPDPWPTWGLWPASAVALALTAGAGSVGLLGIDLGRADAPDPQQAPLVDLLALLADHASVPCFDLGAAGARKPHWPVAALDAVASGGAVEPLALDARPWLSRDARWAKASALWRRTEALGADAAIVLEDACAVRDGETSPRARARMIDGLERLLTTGAAVSTRIDVQDGLGVSFLPRFWRTPPDTALGARLWRAAALASHELVEQWRALGRRLERAA